MMKDNLKINGLPLPTLLLELLKSNQWRHPGDEILRSFIPFLREPVDFLSLEQMHFESQWLMADDPRSSHLFHEARVSKQVEPISLPWLDVEKAVFIAVNRFPGSDIGIALDYRTSFDDPCVVASDWWSTPGCCIWQEVAPSFSEFVKRLKITRNDHE